MAEPDNQTLRLLREFREEFKEFHEDFTEFRLRTDDRFAELVKLFAGEGVLARYAVVEVDKRLESLEKRVKALEGGR